MGSVRISGKDFKDFCEAAWPNGYVWNDGPGVAYIPDGATAPVAVYAEDGRTIIIPEAEIFEVPNYWALRSTDGSSQSYNMVDLIQDWLREKTVEPETPRKLIVSVRISVSNSRLQGAHAR